MLIHDYRSLFDTTTSTLASDRQVNRQTGKHPAEMLQSSLKCSACTPKPASSQSMQRTRSRPPERAPTSCSQSAGSGEGGIRRPGEWPQKQHIQRAATKPDTLPGTRNLAALLSSTRGRNERELHGCESDTRNLGRTISSCSVSEQETQHLPHICDRLALQRHQRSMPRCRPAAGQSRPGKRQHSSIRIRLLKRIDAQPTPKVPSAMPCSLRPASRTRCFQGRLSAATN
jgi:hypothetical protein